MKECNMPKISVILPAYNAEKYIKEAIDSVLLQTYRDFELIILNELTSGLYMRYNTGNNPIGGDNHDTFSQYQFSFTDTVGNETDL